MNILYYSVKDINIKFLHIVDHLGYLSKLYTWVSI